MMFISGYVIDLKVKLWYVAELDVACPIFHLDSFKKVNKNRSKIPRALWKK